MGSPTEAGGPRDYLAVDLGASGGRVVVGRVVPEGGVHLGELHRFGNGPVDVRGRLHWDVLGLWRELLGGLRAYRTWAEGAEAGVPLASVSVCTWGVDYAYLAADGGLLAPPGCYRDPRVDASRAAMTERLAAAGLDAAAWYARTGVQPADINTAPRLFAADHRGDPRHRAAAVTLLMPDLFHYWLSGRCVAERTIASTTALLDARTGEWSARVLAALGIAPGLLPPVVPPGTDLGPIDGGVAAATGLPPATRVVATGAHDTASAVVAVAGLAEGGAGEVAFVSSGTWSLVGVEAEAPALTEEARLAGITNEAGVGGRALVLRNLTGLWILQECRRCWTDADGPPPWDTLLREAAAAPPLASLIDPEDAGFARPGDMPAAVRAYCARTGQPEPPNRGAVARCCLESLALATRAALDALETVTARRLAYVCIVGGGSRNDLLNAFTANACARPVTAGPAEATAMGNVLAQALAAGQLPDLAAARRLAAAAEPTRRFRPAPAEAAAWATARERFGRLAAGDT